MGGLAHRNLVSVVERELAGRDLPSPSILDAGCGDGALLALIGATLPGRRFGFDSPDYLLKSSDSIGSRAGGGADIRATEPDGAWPFGDEELDVVVSNQVGEHVVDFETFCSEHARVLKPGGFGVHAFPLRHMLVEPHMHLPLVHKVRDHSLRAWLIAGLSRLGLGIYRSQALPEGVGIEEFARSHADYSRTFTTYRTWREVADAFHRHGFRVSYRHTSTLAQRGLWRMAGRERPGRPLPPPLEAALFPALRMVVSCTIVVEKRQDYRFTWRMEA